MGVFVCISVCWTTSAFIVSETAMGLYFISLFAMLYTRKEVCICDIPIDLV